MKYYETIKIVNFNKNNSKYPKYLSEDISCPIWFVLTKKEGAEKHKWSS